MIEALIVINSAKKRLRVRPGCRIDKIYKMTEDVFTADYKGHSIDIRREFDDYFYILVTGPDGYDRYNGRWDHGGKATIKDAVEEALCGSCIIERMRNA